MESNTTTLTCKHILETDVGDFHNTAKIDALTGKIFDFIFVAESDLGKKGYEIDESFGETVEVHIDGATYSFSVENDQIVDEELPLLQELIKKLSIIDDIRIELESFNKTTPKIKAKI